MIDENENVALKKWFITSIYHDVGYPSEKFEALVMDFFNTSIGRKIRSQFDWSSVLLADKNLEHIDELSSLFAQKVGDSSQAKVFEKWFCKRLVEDHDHGTLTALMLLNKDKIKWEPVEWEIVEEAALAVSLHNWKRDSNNSPEFDLGQLSVENFSLAFFLSYCDTAQEWGRRVLLELLKKRDTPAAIPNITVIDSKLDEIEVLGDKTVVTIKYSSKSDEKIKEKETLEDIFKIVKSKFLETWYLKENEIPRLMIEGKDRDKFSIGSFGAEFYEKGSFEKNKRAKIEEELLRTLNKDIIEEIKKKKKTEFDSLVVDILEKKKSPHSAAEKLCELLLSDYNKPTNPESSQ